MSNSYPPHISFLQQPSIAKAATGKGRPTTIDETLQGAAAGAREAARAAEAEDDQGLERAACPTGSRASSHLALLRARPQCTTLPGLPPNVQLTAVEAALRDAREGGCSAAAEAASNKLLVTIGGSPGIDRLAQRLEDLARILQPTQALFDCTALPDVPFVEPASFLAKHERWVCQQRMQAQQHAADIRDAQRMVAAALCAHQSKFEPLSVRRASAVGEGVQLARRLAVLDGSVRDYHEWRDGLAAEYDKVLGEPLRSSAAAKAAALAAEKSRLEVALLICSEAESLLKLAARLGRSLSEQAACTTGGARAAADGFRLVPDDDAKPWMQEWFIRSLIHPHGCRLRPDMTRQGPVRVVRVLAVENRRQRQQYETHFAYQKEGAAEAAGAGRHPPLLTFIQPVGAPPLREEDNEAYLLHGTTEELAKLIAQRGLDPRLANSRGKYGQGSYLTDQVCKADQYSRRGAAGLPGAERVVLVCRAAVGWAHCPSGRPEKASPWRVPPENPATGLPFDSVFAQAGVADGGDQVHNEVVAFSVHQAQPQYLVYYTV